MRWFVGWLLMSGLTISVFVFCSAFTADIEDPVNELDGIPPLIGRHASIAEDLAFEESEVGS